MSESVNAPAYKVARAEALDSTPIVGVKDSAGMLHGISYKNVTANPTFFQVYDALSGDVVLGTTTPKYTLPTLTSSEGNFEIKGGIKFDTGISIGATTDFAATGDFAVDLDVSVSYI